MPQITAADIRQILIASAGIAEEALDGHDLPLDELGVDSLAILELQAVAEDTFGADIPDGALKMTVSQIVEHVRNGSR